MIKLPRNIVKQPNEKYAVYSPILEDFLVYDCTTKEIENFFIKEAIEQAKKEVKGALEEIEQSPNFRLSWENCLIEYESIHGNTEQLQVYQNVKPEPVYVAATNLVFYAATYDEGTILTRLSETDPFRVQRESEKRFSLTADYFSIGEHKFGLMATEYKIKES